MKEFLNNIITQAGQIAMDYRNQASELKVNRKSDKDLVSEADEAVEAFLISEIQKAYPDHAIFAEETGQHEGNEHRWIIDPIDGTTSFVHQQLYFSVSIAYEKNGVLECAAVNAPALDELFEAQKGCGATLNNKPIRVSNRDKLIDSVLATGFACVRSDLTHNNMPYFEKILPNIRGIRRYGSAAIDLCYVACGRMEGFWELNLKPYDISAGWLILEEAGGKLTDYDNGQANIPNETVGTNGSIHDDLINYLTTIKSHQVK